MGVIGDTSPWLMERRRLLTYREPELYPIGTNIITWSGYKAARQEGKAIRRSDGVFADKTSSYENGASEIYIPISSKYTYQKNDNRIYTLAFYDKSKTFISYRTENNLTVKQLVIPSNAAFIRLTWWAGNNLNLRITRIS